MFGYTAIARALLIFSCFHYQQCQAIRVEDTFEQQNASTLASDEPYHYADEHGGFLSSNTMNEHSLRSLNEEDDFINTTLPNTITLCTCFNRPFTMVNTDGESFWCTRSVHS